jgi:hypothetical protein
MGKPATLWKDRFRVSAFVAMRGVSSLLFSRLGLVAAQESQSVQELTGRIDAGETGSSGLDIFLSKPAKEK